MIGGMVAHVLGITLLSPAGRAVGPRLVVEGLPVSEHLVDAVVLGKINAWNAGATCVLRKMPDNVDEDMFLLADNEIRTVPFGLDDRHIAVCNPPDPALRMLADNPGRAVAIEVFTRSESADTGEECWTAAAFPKVVDLQARHEPTADGEGWDLRFYGAVRSNPGCVLPSIRRPFAEGDTHLIAATVAAPELTVGP